MDRAGDTTCSLIGSLALGAEGATIGANVGLILGPIGAVIGGIVGGVMGGIAGNSVGRAIWEGGKIISKVVANSVKTAASRLLEGSKSVTNSIGNFFISVFC